VNNPYVMIGILADQTGEIVLTKSITTEATEFSSYGNLLTEPDVPRCSVATAPAPLSSATYSGLREQGVNSATRRRSGY
jgi:hypothetical protein